MLDKHSSIMLLGRKVCLYNINIYISGKGYSIIHAINILKKLLIASYLTKCLTNRKVFKTIPISKIHMTRW